MLVEVTGLLVLPVVTIDVVCRIVGLLLDLVMAVEAETVFPVCKHQMVIYKTTRYIYVAIGNIENYIADF